MNAENLKTIATEIETALCEVTKKLVSREGDAKVRPREGVDNACWTKAIKTRLCKLGACKKYYICALGVEWVCDGKPDGDHGCAVEHEKKCKPNHGEWLYDVCWLDWKKKDPPRLKQVVLAAECEWGNDGDIYDDFEKLVQSRAGLRVMIFTKKNQEAVNGIDR